jgi:hypothetical protein
LETGRRQFIATWVAMFIGFGALAGLIIGQG